MLSFLPLLTMIPHSQSSFLPSPVHFKIIASFVLCNSLSHALNHLPTSIMFLSYERLLPVSFLHSMAPHSSPSFLPLLSTSIIITSFIHHFSLNRTCRIDFSLPVSSLLCSSLFSSPPVHFKFITSFILHFFLLFVRLINAFLSLLSKHSKTPHASTLPCIVSFLSTPSLHVFPPL